MADSTIELPFSPFSTEAWKARVEKELKGKSYNDFLFWKSLDGFEIEAWQDKLPEVTPHLHALKEEWKIVESVCQTDAREANKHALEALMSGAEAIWFDKGYLGAAAEVATQSIDQEVAPVFINGGNCVDPYRDLLKTGAGELTLGKEQHLINGLRFRERGANPIQEIAYLIAQALEIGIQTEFKAPLLFKTGVGTSLLTEIAKLRAIRWLWAGILKTEGLTVENPTIFAVNLANGYAINDEHSNVLRATSSAISAVLGGAQFVLIEPWDRHQRADHKFSARISRNVQVLLKEEGRVNKNLNPADGSYFIESLTAALAPAAWKLVQEIQEAGGFSAYAKSGSLRKDIEASRNKLLEAYSSEKKTLLGVNKYPPSVQKEEQSVAANAYALLPDFLSLPSELQKTTAS